jgi:dTDP-4-dehydrorhamnose 3,5-epimerase
MVFVKTQIEGCYIINPKIFLDDRGHFYVPYNKKELDDCLGYEVNFIQDNSSSSRYGVIRGLHFQTGENAQAKLVSCSHGLVLDVIVDIRKESPSYGKYISVHLSDFADNSVFIPRGCAHGFSVLTNKAKFNYKVDNHYNKESESGIVYNDPTLNINWGIPKGEEIVAERDKSFPSFLSL